MSFWKARSKAKFGNKRSSVDGYSMASGLERSVYLWLKAQEIDGTLTIERVQDQVYLSKAKILYKPDFRILDHKMNTSVWVEAKGFETPEWRIKRRLWMAYGPGLLRIYKGAGMRFSLSEEILGGKGDE